MKKIILVEHDADLLDFYRSAFARTNFDVEVASNMDEMLEELRCIRNGESQKPDLILLDFMIPDTRGLEILKAIKKSCHTSDIPVFTFTNYQNPHLNLQIEHLNIRPEKYLIKAEHTPAQLVGIINDYFNADVREDIHTTLS